MYNLKQIIEKQQNLIAKTVSSSQLGISAGANNLVVRQDLDPIVTDITQRNTPFRDIVKREAGEGEGFTYNVYEALNSTPQNPRNAVYGDGGLPTARAPKFGSHYHAYAPIGLQSGVTGLAQAQMRSLIDLYATEVEKTTKNVIQSEEWLNFWGSTTTLNAASLPQYPGLDELITTNVIDAQGGVISKTLIDRACEMIAQYGGMATHIFTSIRVGINIDNFFNQYAQVIINQSDRDSLRLGNKVRDISTVAGVLSLSPDFFINPGNQYTLPNGQSSFPNGAPVSTVFILAMPFISMKDLQPLGMEELGRTADKRDFFVNEYTGLKLTAEPWCAKITNVSDAIISA